MKENNETEQVVLPTIKKKLDVEKMLENLNLDLEQIGDPVLRQIIEVLLNIIEYQGEEVQTLKAENQRLRDENNRLKGEQGKPNIRKQSKDNRDVSSEKERKKKKKKPRTKKGSKKNRLTVNRTERCDFETGELPGDAIFKGYYSKIVQDIIITPDNVEFKKAIYYSPSLKKTFVASVPHGYEGDFGPNIKSLILDQHYHAKMTESAIERFLANHGVDISVSSISRIIADDHSEFHQEKRDIVEAGLASSRHQQMDDTSARVKGKNAYTHILCNDHYTAYFTRKGKDRLTIIDVLTSGEMQFCLNDLAFVLMEEMGLPTKRLKALKALVCRPSMNRETIDTLLLQLFPDPHKHQTNRRIILEASAIVSYQQRADAIDILLTDDAPQFRKITRLLALCWIHDGRHYKKLMPIVPAYRKQLADFQTKYWDYYHQLLAYKEGPSKALAQSLGEAFDALFAMKTGYEKLDARIEKTRTKKAALLLVLQYPTLPLHNNTSELGARSQARYRDISFHTMSEKGTQAKDIFMTLVGTAKKLQVNTYQYFYDRITKAFQLPSLASLVRARGQPV